MRNRLVSVCSLLGFVPIIALGGCLAEDASGSEEDVGSTALAAKSPPGLAKKVRDLAAEHGVGPVAAAPTIRPALVELGQALAFDKILSGNQNISCMTCHHPDLGLGDQRSLSVGEGGAGLGLLRLHPDGTFIPRNAPSLFNLHLLGTMFWDGRVKQTASGELITPAGAQLTPAMKAVFEFGAVSAQAMFPVTSMEEMRGHAGQNPIANIPASDFTAIWNAYMSRLQAIPRYEVLFEAAYPGTDFSDMTFAHAANAIAGFEIAAYSATNTDWDRFLAGNNDALTQDELKGAEAFFTKGACAGCHSGPAFTNLDHHNTGLAQLGPGKGDGADGRDDFGRQRVSGAVADRYKFRTPPLRNVAITGPWGHDGQFTDLTNFVRHYNDPHAQLLAYDPTEVEEALRPTILDTFAQISATIDPLMNDANLNEVEIGRIVLFLDTLTDPASLDLIHTVPESVPSGIPLGDDLGSLVP